MVGFHLQHHFHLLLALGPLYLFCNVLCSKVILSGGSDRCGLQRAETEGPARGQVWRQDLVRLQDQVSLDLKRGFLTPVCPAAARRSTWTLARRRRACRTTEPPSRTSVATPSSQTLTLHNSGIQCEWSLSSYHIHSINYLYQVWSCDVHRCIPRPGSRRGDLCLLQLRSWEGTGVVSGEHANFKIAFKSEEKPLQAIWFAHLRDDEGLSEQEIYDWCVR